MRYKYLLENLGSCLNKKSFCLLFHSFVAYMRTTQNMNEGVSERKMWVKTYIIQKILILQNKYISDIVPAIILFPCFLFNRNVFIVKKGSKKERIFSNARIFLLGFYFSKYSDKFLQVPVRKRSHLPHSLLHDENRCYLTYFAYKMKESKPMMQTDKLFVPFCIKDEKRMKHIICY